MYCSYSYLRSAKEYGHGIICSGGATETGPCPSFSPTADFTAMFSKCFQDRPYTAESRRTEGLLFDNCEPETFGH